MEQEEKIIIVGILMTAAVLSIGTMIAMLSNSAAASYLKIHTPDQGQKVPAGEFFIVTGSSVPSNATRTHCTVMLQTNQHGYMPVTPLGTQGTGPAGTYTTWQGRTSEPIKVGPNQVEGQFQCFTPNTNIPNFTKHLVHNFTGVPTTPAPIGNNILNTTQTTPPTIPQTTTK